MKAQILADFVVECTPTNDSQIEEQFQEETSKPAWILYMDGASNAQRCSVGLILTNIDGMVTEYAFQFDFKDSNNQVEYKALIAGLKIAKDLSEIGRAHV